VSAQRSDDLLTLLQDAGFEFVVVGGVAAIAHGATRSTRDLDVVAPFTPANLQRLLDALGPHAPKHLTRPDLGVVSQTAAELSAHRLLLLVSDLGRLDVLREVPPIGAHDDLETVEMELVAGRRFRVISLDQLIAIKAALTRPQDKDVERDLRAIRALRAPGP
jgi:predicted nucleotidyltransferase